MSNPLDEDVPRLRDDVNTLSALVQQTSQHLGIDAAFVEKDFWVTELLRSVSRGEEITTAAASEPVTVVFKDGTSLSRVFHLIDRFSEDVDILVTFPLATGIATRDRALRRLAERARQHLGLSDDQCVTQESTKGVKRNIRFHYPRAFPSQNLSISSRNPSGVSLPTTRAS